MKQKVEGITTERTKATLTVFWEIRGMTLVDWLPQGASLNRAYFDEHILQVMHSELHTGEEKKHCPWPMVHMQNARPHTSMRNSARMQELRLKRVSYPPFSPDIATSDFVLFRWLKGELCSRQVREINGLFEIVDEILSTLISDPIARVFWNRIERLTQVINLNGDYL
jgi:histone-lysine N-methyltransferase SETMAR